MTFRISRLKSIAVAAIGALALAGMVTTSASAKPTMLYHSNGYAVKPAMITGWVPDGTGLDLELIGGRTDDPAPNYGAIDWQSWKKQKAVGKGAGWLMGKSSSTKADFPWNGSNLRVTAYGAKRGHFTKMKVHARDSRPGYENYTLTLKFAGKNPKGLGLGVHWLVVNEDDGAP